MNTSGFYDQDWGVQVYRKSTHSSWALDANGNIIRGSTAAAAMEKWRSLNPGCPDDAPSYRATPCRIGVADSKLWGADCAGRLGAAMMAVRTTPRAGAALFEWDGDSARCAIIAAGSKRRAPDGVIGEVATQGEDLAAAAEEAIARFEAHAPTERELFSAAEIVASTHNGLVQPVELVFRVGLDGGTEAGEVIGVDQAEAWLKSHPRFYPTKSGYALLPYGLEREA